MGIGVLIECVIGILVIIAVIILARWGIEYEVWFWTTWFEDIAHHIKRIKRKLKKKKEKNG